MTLIEQHPQGTFTASLGYDDLKKSRLCVKVSYAGGERLFEVLNTSTDPDLLLHEAIKMTIAGEEQEFPA